MAVMTTTTLSTAVKTYYDKKLLKWTAPELLHDKFAQKSMVPKGFKTHEWRRYDKIAQASSPGSAYGSNGYLLAEGVVPTQVTDATETVSIVTTVLTATPAQYGAVAVGTDLVDTTVIDPILDLTTKRLAQHAAEAIDTITRTALIAGTSIQYAGAATTNDTITATDYINFAELVEAIGQLKTNLAEPVGGGKYAAIISIGTWQRLIQDPDFREAVVFGQKDNMFTGKLGSFMGVDFYETTRAYSVANASSVTVHYTLIFGSEAYGTVGFAGMGMETIFTAPGGQTDPFKQVWKMAWKSSHAVVLLNNLFFIVLRHAV